MTVGAGVTPPRAAGSPVTYRCAECAKRVAVVEGRVIRACPHPESPVTADLTATVYSESKVSG